MQRKGLFLIAAGLSALVLSIGTPSPLSASEIDPAEWRRFTSAGFSLSTNGDGEVAAKTLSDLEHFHRAFGELAPGFELQSPQPTEILAFGSLASFEPFQKGVSARGSKVLGQFLSHPDGNYITLLIDPRFGTELGVVIHEYVHHLVNENLPKVPRWLNEGLAEYYSTFRVERDYAVIGLPVERHMRWWRAGHDLELAQVLDLSTSESAVHSTDGAGRFYAVSWGLVHYLLSSRGGPAVLAQLLEDVRLGASASDSLLTSLSLSRKELATTLRRHVSSESLPTASFALERLGSVPIDETAASPAIVFRTLADLAARLGNEQQAEGLFDLALAHAPDDADALSGLAWLRDSQGRLEEASLLFDDALTLGPALPRSHLQRGRHFLRRFEFADGDDFDRRTEWLNDARLAFELARALAPDMAEPHAMLGAVHLYGSLDAADGLASAGRAVELRPTRPDLIHTLLRLHLKIGNFEESKALTEGPYAQLVDEEGLAGVRREIVRAELLHSARAAFEDQRWEDGLSLFDQAISHTENADLRMQMEEQLNRLEEQARKIQRAGGDE